MYFTSLLINIPSFMAGHAGGVELTGVQKVFPEFIVVNEVEAPEGSVFSDDYPAAMGLNLALPGSPWVHAQGRLPKEFF